MVSMAQLVNFRRSMVVHRYQPFGASPTGVSWVNLGISIWAHSSSRFIKIIYEMRYIYIDFKWYQDLSMKYAFDEFDALQFPYFFFLKNHVLPSIFLGIGCAEIRAIHVARRWTAASQAERVWSCRNTPWRLSSGVLWPGKKMGKFTWNYGDLDLWDEPITMGGFHDCRLV